MQSSGNIDLWKGEFGDSYTKRNQSSSQGVDARRSLFRSIFDVMPFPKLGVIAEIGAGGGANLVALRRLLGDETRLIAVEPNAQAREHIYNGCATDITDILDGEAERIPLGDGAADLVFTSGLLIHIPPERLGTVMDEIFRVSRRYIVCIEYFSPEHTERRYRDRDGAMWTGDFGSMYLDRFQELHSCAYGFAWKRDTGLDNVTWHLLEKRPC